MISYKEKDDEQDEEKLVDFDSLEVFEAFIIRTSVCNEVIVWPGYIEESNKKSYLDKDNSDSLMFIEKCSNNVQEQEVNAKLEQSSTKMDVVSSWKSCSTELSSYKKSLSN